MVDFLLPRTDAGALAQVIAAAVIYAGAGLAVRRQRELLLFVTGLAVMTAAWFALRTVH